MGSTKPTLLAMERQLHRVGTNDDITGGLINIFTIANYGIRITGLFGHVTVGGDAGCTILIRFNPTGAGVVNDFCAVSPSTTWPINTLLTFDGDAGDQLNATTGIGHAAAGAEMWLGDCCVCPGVLTMTTEAADADLVIDWYLSYHTGGTGAIVTAN